MIHGRVEVLKGKSDSHGCPILFVHSAEILIATILAAAALVKVVIGGVRNKRRVAEICQRGTAC